MTVTKSITRTVEHTANLDERDGQTVVVIRSNVRHRIVDGGGRRRWQEEGSADVDAYDPTPVLTLTPTEALRLAAAIADTVAYVTAAP